MIPEEMYGVVENVIANMNIVLGEQSEQVYNLTNNFEIALAFREAGEAFGS